MGKRPLLALAVCGLACGGGLLRPAPLDTRNDTCAWCRMAVSDARFAAQLVAPGEEPRFFDDIGCLRDWLAGSAGTTAGAAAFVADHGSKEWVRAGAAVYSSCPGLETPMNSHLVAHADAASKSADPAATGCAVVAAAVVFAGSALPDAGGGTR